MKQFQFKLQSVLDLKQQEEDNARFALAEAEETVAKARMALSLTVQELEQCFVSTRAAHDSAASADQILVHTRYQDQLGRRKAAQIEQINEAQLEADKRRQGLQAIVKERKILESLKERQFGAYQYALQRLEQAALDETASRKYVIQQHETGMEGQPNV